MATKVFSDEFTDVNPLADNTYWLGSDTLGWMGVKFPDTKVYQIDATTVGIRTIADGGSNLSLGDDVGYKLGADSDGVIYHKSASLNANTTLASVIVGTPVTTATAANSLFISDVTSNGDIHLIYSVGGNSKTAIFCDGSVHTIYIPGNLIAQGGFNIGASSYLGFAGTGEIYGNNADNALIRASLRDNGVGLVIIGGWYGGADPYWGLIRDDTGVATNAVTDIAVFGMGAGANNESAGQGVGTSWKIGNAASQLEERGSIDLVLVTATDAGEVSKFNHSIMAAGSMTLMASLDSKGWTFPTSVDSALVADEVTVGGYDIAEGNRALAISAETAAIAGVGVASTHKLPVRYNGVTYYALVTTVA